MSWLTLRMGARADRARQCRTVVKAIGQLDREGTARRTASDEAVHALAEVQASSEHMVAVPDVESTPFAARDALSAIHAGRLRTSVVLYGFLGGGWARRAGG